MRSRLLSLMFFFAGMHCPETGAAGAGWRIWQAGAEVWSCRLQAACQCAPAPVLLGALLMLAVSPVLQAWRDRALELALWAESRLVNRTDAWGGYGQTGTLTCPPKIRRGKDRLNRNHLVGHFSGHVTYGVHALSAQDTCLWIGFDVDAHNEGVDPARNWQIAQELTSQLVKVDLQPVIEDSNGAGGYHLWVLFTRPIPADLAYRLAKWVKSRSGVPEIESFPKQRSVKDTPCGYGNWMRMPGKHPRREHWTRFYDPDTETWLEGADAVQHLLDAPVNDPAVLEDLRPHLPEFRPPPPPPTVNVLPLGEQPVCVRDLLVNGIRKCGDRNKGLLSLCRYWKATQVSQDDAIRQGIAFVRRIPRSLTTSTLTDVEIEANVRSVVSAVYSGNYPFDCWYMRSLGTPQDPVACNAGQCRFISYRIPVQIPVAATVPTEPITTEEIPHV